MERKRLIPKLADPDSSCRRPTGTSIAKTYGGPMRCWRRARRRPMAPMSQRLRRLVLAIAAVLDGASREEAATIGGMDRQTLRDWGIRFNEQGPDGLINIPSPGAPPKLNSRHKG